MMAQPSLKSFGGSAVYDAAVLSDSRVLAALPPAAVEGALRLADAYLQQEEAEVLAALLDAFCSAHGVKPKAARSAVRTLTVLVSGAIKYALDGDAFAGDLKALGFDAASAAAAGGHFDAHRGALAQVAADAAVRARAVLDAEWRFGVTVSTNDVGRVGSTYVQLRLLSAGADGGPPAEHLVELSAAAFYTLLGQLEKAKTYLDVLAAQ